MRVNRAHKGTRTDRRHVQSFLKYLIILTLRSRCLEWEMHNYSFEKYMFECSRSETIISYVDLK